MPSFLRQVQKARRRSLSRWHLAWLGAVAVSACAQTETSRSSWIGQPGITETVSTIRARGAVADASGHSPRIRKPRLVWRQPDFPLNPESPRGAWWPAQTATVIGSWSTRAAGVLAAQSVTNSFLGAQLSDTIGYVPPDSMADVGTNQIIVCVNGRIRTFGKDGVADGHLDTTTDNFFASVLGGSSTSDPRVRYDRLSSRWFITMITVTTPTNAVLLAVSSGPTIGSASSFTFFSFLADASNFGDYDTLGVDASALYIGLNLFGTRTFVNTKAFVVNKAKLLQGTLAVTAFSNLISSTGHPPQTHGPFTPQGVNNDDPAAAEGYFIGVDFGATGTLAVRRISDPGGTPSISANLLVTVPATVSPLGGVPALGSNSKLDDLDTRLFATRMHQGSLWTAHNIEVNASGVASSSGGRDGARWYQLTNMTGTPVLAQAGTLYDASAVNPRSFWIPSCAMSGQGHMALGCSVAGAAEHAEIATAGRWATDPLGTLQSPIAAVSSATTYNIGLDNGVYRWGDFSVTTVDPSDDMTFWTIQEYCNANDSWGVRVIQLAAPPPALPINCSPATLTPGGGNVDVVVSASSTAGAGFFDPGPGFPNHLTAAVSGSGITVNSITWNNPTNLTLNLAVASDASAGGRTLTVTNPDGQSTSSPSFVLTVIGPSNQPPVLAPIADQYVYAGLSLVVTNSAFDPDPGQSLTFSLDPGAPAGATIDSATGVLRWDPTDAQVGTHSIAVRVTDDGQPPLSAGQSVAVDVLSAPVVFLTVSNDSSWLTWASAAGATYQVQFESNLADGAWIPLVPDITATGLQAEAFDPVGTNAARFYRLRIVP